MDTRILTADQEVSVGELYQQGFRMSQLAIQFKMSRQGIGLVLSRLGIKGRSYTERFTRKYTLDEAAFDDAVVNDEAAYFVGLLMADGCVRSRPHSGDISLALAGKDGLMVKALRDFLGSNHPLRHIPGGRKLWNGEEDHWVNVQPQTEFRVTSAKLTAALASYGVVPNKSAREEVRLLDGNPHFWRGVVDGDGTVALRRRKNQNCPSIKIVGSKNIVLQFLDFCRTIADTDAMPRLGSGCWRGGVEGQAAVKVLNILYGGVTVALPRKHRTAKKILGMDWTPLIRSHMHLTAEELLRLHAEKGTWQAVGVALDMDPFVLRHTRRRLGIYQNESHKPRADRPLAKFTADALQEAFAAAGSWAGAATLLGVAPGSIAYLRRRLGIP